MSFSLTRLSLIGYGIGLALVLGLLLVPNSSQAQKGFGVSTGYRATPALPTIAIPVLQFNNGGFGAAGGSGVVGVGGSGGSSSVSGSVTTQIMTVNLGQFFPNNGQTIGLPPPTMNTMLNNYMSDSTGALWSLLLVGSGGGGGGGVGGGGLGGIGGGGIGGIGGIGGGGVGGVGGGIGGFAGKGMGGFNGKKAL